MTRGFTTILFILLFAAQSVAVPSPKWNQQYQDYINLYKELAIREMLIYGIPASITLAQGILESGAGQSDLARRGNNHFGIKCKGWTGRSISHDDDETGECFRAYASVVDSYEDHSRFLAGKSRYNRLFSLRRTDYKGWARGLKSCGYATSPTYAKRLIEIIEEYDLHRYDYATTSNYVEPRGDRVVPSNSPSRRTDVRSATSSQELPAHAIYINNKNCYVIAREGDTFRIIGEEVGISYRKLAKYNERNKNDVLKDGDVVYLKKKRTRAEKEFKKKMHVVQRNESMYDIAQRYGIRLKSLHKKNFLPPDYQLRAGDKLRVY